MIRVWGFVVSREGGIGLEERDGGQRRHHLPESMGSNGIQHLSPRRFVGSEEVSHRDCYRDYTGTAVEICSLIP